MLVVQDIKIKEVSRDIVELLHYRPAPDPREFRRVPTKEELEIPIEVIHGKTIITPDGREVCIGMSKKVQTALGLPFELIDDLQDDVERLHREIDMQLVTIDQLRGRYAGAQDTIKQFRAMTLWRRIKFLFKRSTA